MFNGIIKNLGKITSIQKNKNSYIIGITSNLKVTKKMIGSSISCDGICLTLYSFKKKKLFFYLSNETIKRSNFSKKKIGDKINIEKSLKHGDELSGHYVQGHIDTVGKIKNISISDKTWILRINIDNKFKRFIVEKASIHINGVSLTISKKLKNSFEISVIPHTLKLTNLQNLKIGDFVNIEFDIFGKYILDISK